MAFIQTSNKLTVVTYYYFRTDDRTSTESEPPIWKWWLTFRYMCISTCVSVSKRTTMDLSLELSINKIVEDSTQHDTIGVYNEIDLAKITLITILPHNHNSCNTIVKKHPFEQSVSSNIILFQSTAICDHGTFTFLSYPSKHCC
jgi:hypothetical protein